MSTLLHGRTATLISLAATVALSGTGFAQERTFNWMREYVRLRVDAMDMTIVGSRAPKEEGRAYRQRVVGGTIAGPQDNPFQVALLQKRIVDDFEAQYCGGSLIAGNIVVTAAHCSDFVTTGQVQVLTEARNLDGTGTRRDVSAIAIHPDWNFVTFEKDVAVWTLASEVQGMQFASLASNDGSVGAQLLATGWGDTTGQGDFPIELRRVEVGLVSRENCNDSNSYDGAIASDMLCAGSEEGGEDTCDGDSGGPLTRGVNNAVLTGITSWGIGCALPNLFGVYARISNESVRSFILGAAGLD